MDALRPRQKLWIERNGRLALSTYRVDLLERVAEHGSLAQAADALGLSYRRAWGKVKELEANLGIPLVRSEVGGAGGGHTTLTPEATAFLEAYRAYESRMQEHLATEFEALFASVVAARTRS
ncbi:MAG: winged helix-turn-helix domain-containing protein [Tepidiformaceae bacterium]